MGNIAFVFPGQGAQAVGMARDAYEQVEAARNIVEQADEVLGYALSELMFNGPEEQLKLTYHTQPALLTASIALYEVFKQHCDIQPDFTAGHSLGEYSALAVSGVLSFKDAVSTVRARGEYMDQAVPSGIGAMAAVLGADRAALQSFCEDISREVGAVELANLNCPGQIVISGTAEGVKAAIERGKSVGAKRIIPLEVSGPFHSSLMKPAADKLQGVLDQISLKPSRYPVVANVTASTVTEPNDVKRLLVQQVYSPVLWEDSVMWLIDQGVDTFIEIGSGTVLAGLIKKCSRAVQVYSINSVESAKQISEELNQRS